MLLKSELLDRMEILFPYETRLADLRRAYIDRDPNSIYRMMVEFSGTDVDDLRKAFRDDNWHKLFHLVNGDWQPEFTTPDGVEVGDLRKFLLEDNIWSMYRLLMHIQPTRILETIKSFHASGTRFDKTALSQGQLKSKLWLIDELKALDLDLGTVFLCAGWYGILATLMFEHGLKIDRIRSFDIDPDVRAVAEKFTLPWVQDDWRFKSVHLDIQSLKYRDFKYEVNRSDGSKVELIDSADTVINTSCEHIDDFYFWFENIPSRTLVVLQGNDYAAPEEHINISESLEEFEELTPLGKVLYSGELKLDKYTRFMRIGYK